MDDSVYQNLKEQSWRKPLTPQEQERLRQILAARPSVRREWNEEQALNRCLESLPQAPVSSNFTARVLQAAQKPQPRKSLLSWNPLGWIRLHWAPSSIAALLMLSVCLLGVRQQQIAHRAETARSIEQFTRVASLPETELLKDFDTINQMSQVQVADTELLEALQ